MAIKHVGTGAGKKRKRGVADRRGRAFQNSQSPHDVSNLVTNVRHRVVIGTDPDDTVVGLVSADRNNLHGETSSSTTSTIYRDVAAMASPKKGTDLSPQILRDNIGDIISARPVKVVARSTGLTPACVKKWRQFGLPAVLVRALHLIITDTELWGAALRLRMIYDASVIEDDIRKIEAPRRGIAHGFDSGGGGMAMAHDRENIGVGSKANSRQ
jgi:hypothetical protein